MVSQPPVPVIEITGLFITSISYGVYLVTLSLSILSLLRGKGRQKKYSPSDWFLLFISVVVFALITLKTVFSFVVVLRAFAFHNGVHQETRTRLRSATGAP